MDIRQGTAVVIPFGPFVSPVDGFTLATGLVSALDNASTGIKLSKNGGAKAVRHATVTATTYDGYGDYLVTLDTTDTNTLGQLRVSFTGASTYFPVWADFSVITANEWDSKYATAIRAANMTQILGTAVPAPTVAGIPRVEIASKLSTVALSTQEKADVDTEALAQLVALDLDHVVHTTIGAAKPTIGSLFDKIMNKDASQTYDVTLDSLQAQHDNTAIVSDVVAGVWDEVMTGHVVAASAAVDIKAAASGGSPATLLDYALSGHNTAGTVGAAMTKANTLAFTSAKVNAQIQASDDIAFTATQLASLSSATDTAAAFLDKALVGHTTTGTVGEAINNAGTGASAATIAAAVWAYLLTSITAAGSIGLKLKNWVLGADNKVLLSTDAQTGVTIPAVTAVGSVTGSVGSVTGAVGSVTGAVGSVTGAVGSVTGNVGGNVNGSVASVTGNVGGNVTGSVASVAGNVGGTVASVVGNVGGNVAGSVASVTADVGITQAGADKVWGSTASFGATLLTNLRAAVWNTLTSGLSTAGSIGKKLADWVLGTDSKVLLSTDSQAGVTIPTVTAVGTVTNLTNAPTAGDLTAAMKASIDTEVMAQLVTLGLNYITHVTMGAGKPAVGSLFDKIMNSSGSQTFNPVTNSLEAIGDGMASSTNVAGAVWDELLAGHSIVGSAARAMVAAGSAGDPWSTPLPGSYGAGTAAAIISAIETTVGLVVAKTNLLPADPASNTQVNTRAVAGAAMTLTSGEEAAIADAIATRAYEGSLTFEQILRLVFAASVLKSSGMEVNAPNFRNLLDTKNRISATVDGNGNRLTVIVDGT